MSKLPFRKVVVSSYTHELAKKHGMKEKDVRKLLVWAVRNMCKMIERGEEVRIKGFGRIYFNKSK